MTQPPLYPMLLKPALKVKVWGGRKLGDLMNKTLPTDDPYGESWEVHDTATVINGELAGQTLGAVLAAYGTDLIGEHNDPAEGFPLLVKLIDAADWLSVQVHPNDEQALALEGEPRGKTEAWLFLQADEGAKIVLGVQPGTNRETMAQAIRDGELEAHIAYAEVNTGDVLLLHANTVHALGPGLMIYEIQQSSDTTYRLYDWNRMGLDGQPRELHIEKGVQVSNVAYLPTITHPEARQERMTLVKSAYFETEQHIMNVHDTSFVLNTNGRFHALTCVEGTARVYVVEGNHELTFGLGETMLVPAVIGQYMLSGHGRVLRSWQPESQARGNGA